MSHKALTLKQRIVQILQDCHDILAASGVEPLARELNASRQGLMQPMQLAIIGKVGSAKSTLVNAILGQAEVVRTGQTEETYNVSWLKYGSSDADINVVFKDGQSLSVPRAQWADWASHMGKNALKDRVKYIEVFFNNEILKEINIIDTPGLDTSQNAIEFLNEVHPDAVVVLFTPNIDDATMSVLHDYNLSATNAIGVLAKPDTIWSIMDSDSDIVELGNRVIANDLIDKLQQVRRSLFAILPVSALLGVASATITDADRESFRSLAGADDVVLTEMLFSPEYFASEDYEVGVDAAERLRLLDKFGLYGINILIDVMRRNENAGPAFLAEALRSKSGFGKFMLTVQAHFGRRAALIKSQKLLQRILAEIQRAKNSSVGEAYKAVAQVESTIVSALLSLHEYREWEFLAKYYDGQITIPAEVAEEFMALCGENGYSATERLRARRGTPPAELLATARERALFWQRQYNVYYVVEPELAEFYKLLVSSYNLLIIDIRKAVDEYESAKETLTRTGDFLGINQTMSE